MKTIHKFPLMPADEQNHTLRHGAKPLHVDVQPVHNDEGVPVALQPFVWVELDEAALPQDWTFLIYQTGVPLANQLLGDQYGTWERSQSPVWCSTSTPGKASDE